MPTESRLIEPAYVHSPDAFYHAKVDYLNACRGEALSNPERLVFVYLDEFSYWRQPTLNLAYEQVGHQPARARRSCQPEAWLRVIGALVLGGGLAGLLFYVVER
jgi:hypothetical protein